MVKITGNFITMGSGGKFAQDRAPEEQLPLSPIEKSEQPEQGDIEEEEGSSQVSESDDPRPYRIALVPGAFKPPHKGHLYMVERLAKIHGIDKVLVIISRPLKEQRALPSGKVISGEDAKLIWEQFIAGSDIEKAEIHLSAAASPVQVVYDFVMKDPDPNSDLVAPEGSEVYMGCGDKEDDPKRFDDIIRKAREDIVVKVVTCPLDVKHSTEYISILDSSPDIKKIMPSVGDPKKDPNELHASDMRFVLELATKNLAGLEMLKDFVPNNDVLAVMGILGLNPIDELPEELPPEENFEEKGAPAGITEIFNSCISEVIREEFQTKMKKRLSRAHSFYLDQGRHDLTKYGAPFENARPRDNSNAFKAK
jgi:cytidyltransferase-like protein